MRSVVCTLRQALKQYPSVYNLTLSPVYDGSTMVNLIDSIHHVYADKYSNTRPRVNIIFNDEDKPIAWGWVISYQNDTLAFIMYVDKEYRRRGIGNQLYEWAIDHAQKRHRKIFVFPHDIKSKNFYAKVKAKHTRKYF